MMDFLKGNFERLKQEGLKDTFTALEAAFAKYGIDYYLIGARARDLWTDHIDLQGKRTTTDVDFCIYIDDYGQYQQLIADLKDNYGFEQNPKEPYRFHFQGIIDIIPFGGIEEDGEVKLQDPPLTLSVYGTREVAEYATVVEGNFKVITLPGLCIMKLIAFHEKPDTRKKDLEDFHFLLRNYGEIAGEQLFDGATYDDLLEGDYVLEHAAARMLGRQMKAMVATAPQVCAKVLDTLSSKLDGFTQEEVDLMYEVRDTGDKKVELYKMLSEVIKGLGE